MHKANGGYLVVDAMELLKNPFSYDALKRAMKTKEIKIEDVLEQYRLISTAGLKPEAIPLHAKTVIIGNPYLYYILHSYDEESRRLFKVKADFDSRMERTQENVEKYAMYVARSRERSPCFLLIVAALPGLLNTAHVLPTTRINCQQDSAKLRT